MKYLLSVIFCTFSLLTYGQQENTGAQPDLPGTLVLDFGPNFLLDAPADMDLKLWGSRGLDVYYLYPVPLGTSPVSFHTGLGLGFVNYSFSSSVTLSDTDSTQIIELDEDIYQTVNKSKLSAHYIDIPLEFRFYSKEDYRGFMVAVGGKVGRLIESYTRIKYEQDGESKTDKFKRDYNLNPWRYGVQARIGFRGIHVFGYYGLSELFQKDRGPQANHFKAGISVALF